MVQKKLFRIEQNMGKVAKPVDAVSLATDDPSRHIELLNEIKALRADIARMNPDSTGNEVETEVKQEVNSEVIADYKQQVIEANNLKNDLQELSSAIDATKIEIASLRADSATEDKIHVAGIELSAVVNDTEVATDGIIAAAEMVETLSDVLRAELDPAHHEILDEMNEQVVAIFESCNFQDITGQRITKVVNTMNFIDERIHGMMDIWGGKDLFADLIPDAEMSEHPDGDLLNGPALPDAQISQADIDALFD